MRNTRLLLAAVIIFIINTVSTGAMSLTYDNAIHEYTGSVFNLVVNNRLLTDLPMPPIIFNDRSLVPIREIFEELGAEVSYDGAEKRVEVTYGKTYIRMYINDNTAYVNGKRCAIPDGIVPKLISRDGGETKTMVPLRFISENVGIPIDFSSEHEAILVNSENYSFDDNNSEQNGKIESVSYNEVNKNTIEIHINADSDISDYSVFDMTEPSRVVADIPGFKVYDTEKISVNRCGVSAVRLGENEERARAVIDVDGEIKNYSYEKVSDTELVITVKTASSTPQPTQTPKPTQTLKPTAKPTQRPAVSKEDKLIVIDSGHGGKDSGAVGMLDGKQIYEKDLTLSIAKKVREVLEKNGYKTDMTRTDDRFLELTEPPAQANEENAAAFVSIHINSVDEAPEASGTEVYYSVLNNGDSYGATSEELAENVLTRMLYYMRSKNRGIKTADHAVTKRCKMPAILVEVGFITNKDELRNMCSDEYQYKVAQGIAEGIMNTVKDITIP